MKNNLRGKIRDFITSEDGKVSAKAPLTFGIATGSVLLANAIVGTTPAAAGGRCTYNYECLYPPHYCLPVHGSCLTQ